MRNCFILSKNKQKKIIAVFSRAKVGKHNIDNRNLNTFRRKCEPRKVGKM